MASIFNVVGTVYPSMTRNAALDQDPAESSFQILRSNLQMCVSDTSTVLQAKLQQFLAHFKIPGGHCHFSVRNAFWARGWLSN